jgi:hypothetical protein
MAAKPFIVSEFNAGRLQAGKINPDRPHIYLDPEYPGYAVKTTAFFGETQEEAQNNLHSAVDRNFKELRRLQAACGQLVVPANFMICEWRKEPQGESGRFMAAHYVQRRAGETPDPQNPKHWSFLRMLGAGQLAYLSETPVGGAFDSELLGLDQYGIGKPFFDRRSNKKELYLQDLELLPGRAFFAYREEPGAPYYNILMPSFSEAVAVTKEWLDHVPAAAEMNDLQSEARRLQRTAPLI